MVIVILGILSAFALPKFADFSSQAETSSIKGSLGGVKSASAIAHAADLAGGGTGKVTLEGVEYTLVNGYPAAADLVAIAGLDGYTIIDGAATASPKEITISLKAAVKDGLCFTYIEADTDAAPTFVPSTDTGTWNDDADDCT